MTKPLSYVEAIRDFHPEYKRPPILHYPLRRAASSAYTHFFAREPEHVLTLAAGLDAMGEAMDGEDPIIDRLMTEFYERDDEESQLADTGSPAPVEFYEHFVCSRIEGATLREAVLVHALGAASQANALAYRIAGRKRPDRTEFERMAEWAISAQELVNLARLFEHGLSLAQWKGRRRGEKGATGRYSPLREIKQRFIEFYRAGEFRSKADAARRFFRGLSTEEQKILAPWGGKEGAVRTLRATLNQASK